MTDATPPPPEPLEGTPASAPVAQPSPPTPPPSGSGAVRLGFDAPLAVANWRPLVHWLLIIPYAVVVGVLGMVLSVLTMVAFFTVLFTKRIPEGMFSFMAMCMRTSWRSTSYHLFLREPYPEFEFTASAADPGGDPATLDIDEPGELNRWLPLVKWLLIIPHLIVLLFLSIGVGVVAIIAFFAVLFTGKWPAGMRAFVIGVMRWSMRVGAYVYLMTDEYPPFSLE